MIEHSTDLVQALKAPIKQIYFKVDFYDQNMNLLQSYYDNVVKYSDFRNGVAPQHFSKYGTMRNQSKQRVGAIQVDYTKPIRRSFAFGLDNSDGLFSWGPNSPIWISNRIKLYFGLLLSDGITIEWVPQGVYIITSPGDAHNKQDGQNVYWTGQDKAYLFTGSRGKFGKELTISKGADIANTIKILAQEGGETMFNFDKVTPMQLPMDMTFQHSDTRWTAMSQLAQMLQCIIYYDVNGYLRLEQAPVDFSKEPAVWTYDATDKNEMFYAGNVRDYDETNFANHIYVVGGSAQTSIVVYDLVVDETVNYTLSQIVAEPLQFQMGTYSNVMDIPVTDQMRTVTETVIEDAQWISQYGVSITNNNLTNTSNSGWSNAGASSSNFIQSGNGFVQTCVNEVNTSRTFGLTQKSTITSNMDITYGIQLDSSGNIRIFENGTEIGTNGQYGTYKNGDIMKVSVESNVVKYYQNQTLVYTSALTPSFPLYIGASLYTNGATLQNVILATFQSLNEQTVGGIQLSQVGSQFYQNEITQSDWIKGTLSNVHAIDDTNYNAVDVSYTGHLELTGFRRNWNDNTINNQTKYGIGSTETVNNSTSYSLSSQSTDHAMSRLNGTDTISGDQSIEVTVTVPSSGHAGIVYCTNYWNDLNGTFGYYVGVENGNVVAQKGSNSATASLTTINTWASTSAVVGDPATLKVTLTGGTHTIYLDGTQVAQFTDSTYTSGGYGLRAYECTGVFDNFGIFNSAGTYTGTRVETFDVSAVKIASNSMINWTQDVPSSNQTLVVNVSLSTDGGTTWGSWQAVTNGGQIPQITSGLSLTNAKIQVQQVLTSTDPSMTPQISNLQVIVNPEYTTSQGTYTSNKFSITSTSINPVQGTSIISWSQITPTNTTLQVQLSVSTDNGVTWSAFQTVTSGQNISQITNSLDLSKCQFQYKALLSTTDATQTPQLIDLTIQCDAPMWKGNPYSIQAVGEVLYEWNNGSPDPAITTIAQAKWRAKYELMNRLGFSENMTLPIAPNFLHDAGDIIQVIDPANNVSGNWRILQAEIPFIPQMQTMKLQKVDHYISDWNAI